MNILKAFFFTFISTILYLGPTEISTQDVNNSSILVCSGADNCETCVRDTACFWCETKLLCKVYSAGNKEAQNKQCGEWKWKSCNEVIEAPTTVIISAATVSAGLIFGKYSVEVNLLCNILVQVKDDELKLLISLARHAQFPFILLKVEVRVRLLKIISRHSVISQ